MGEEAHPPGRSSREALRGEGDGGGLESRCVCRAGVWCVDGFGGEQVVISAASGSQIGAKGLWMGK